MELIYQNKAKGFYHKQDPNVLSLRTSWYNYLRRWSWEYHICYWFVKPIDSRMGFKFAKGMLKELRERCTGMKFAAIILYTNSTHFNSHLHILLTSVQEYKYTLLHPMRKLYKIPRLWMHIHAVRFLDDRSPFKGSLYISEEGIDWTQQMICKYVTNRGNMFVDRPDTWCFEYYRPNLLLNLSNNCD